MQAFFFTGSLYRSQLFGRICVQCYLPRSRSVSWRERGGNVDDVWSAVEHMAKELAKKAGVERKTKSLSNLKNERDEV